MLYRWKRSCAISSTQLTKWKWSFFMMSEENECSFHDDFLVFTRGKCVFFIEISKWNESSYIKKKLCIFKKKEIKMWEFKILNGWEWEGLGTTKRREGVNEMLEETRACERTNPMGMKGSHVLTGRSRFLYSTRVRVVVFCSYSWSSYCYLALFFFSTIMMCIIKGFFIWLETCTIHM